MDRVRTFLSWCLTMALVLFAATADAAVKHEGAWPDADKPGGDKKVTLDLDGIPRAQAVRKLADAAGWSLVVQTSLTDSADLIDVHVKDQPASKVLDLVLDDGWIASRDGKLVSLRRGTADHVAPPSGADPTPSEPTAPPAPPAPGAPPAPPAPPAPIALPAMPALPALPAPPAASHLGRHGSKGEDRTVTGSSLVIQKDETVHDVTVFGGSLDVLGHVTGDVSVTGGAISVRKGAHIEGDVTGVGGSIEIEEGADVEGDVGVVGGYLHRDDKGNGMHVDIDDDDEHEHKSVNVGPRLKPLHESLRDIGAAITRAAFLFIFGAILLALGTKRLETMRCEVAARPMRSFALGAVGLVVGLVGFLLLCVTIIGIPVAFVALLLAIFGSYAGVVAVLTTAGEALLRHKTENTYVHLAAGCAMFFVATALPFVGGFVMLGVSLAGIGVFVGTRAAGFWPQKKAPSAGPYRTPDVTA